MALDIEKIKLELFSSWRRTHCNNQAITINPDNIKKGSIYENGNQRSIVPLPGADKIMNNILLNLICPHFENIKGEHKPGFGRGRSTLDQIFILKLLFWG